MKQTLIVIAGPTAAGKSEIAAELARKIGEVISADSMQVYRHMDIGSQNHFGRNAGRASPYDRCGRTDESFDVVRYAEMAKENHSRYQARSHIYSMRRYGFYIQAVTRDIDFTETGALPGYRENFLNMLGNTETKLFINAFRKSTKEHGEIHPNNKACHTGPRIL